MKKKPEYERTVIHSLNEIPEFADEDEEREFWWTHELSNELWDSLPKTTHELDERGPLPESSPEFKKGRKAPAKA